MKSLIIIANPSKTSFSYAIAQAYKEWAEQSNQEVKILDLYDVDQPYLNYESTQEFKQWNLQSDTSQTTMIQQMITDCDEMIYIFPIRWGGMPAILKNFFDSNLSAGFAFNFVKWLKKQEQLLTDKTAKIFTHCDAPALLYSFSLISGTNIKNYLKRMVLWFCGIKMTEYNIMGNLRKSSQEKKEAYLAKVRASWAAM